MDKDKTIQKTASCSIGLDPKTGSPTIFDANGKEASVFQILGYLYVAGADSLEDIFAGSNNEELIAEKLEKCIESKKLEAIQDCKENSILAASWNHISSLYTIYNPCDLFSFLRRKKSPFKVEKKKGNTIYHIQNLNVYINADVVQQLNMNPEKVINIIEDKLNDEIDKLVKSNSKG